MEDYLNPDKRIGTLEITDNEKWLLRQDDTKRVEFAIDATNGNKLVTGAIVSINSDGKGVLWGSKTTDAYDNEAYGLLMSVDDISVEAKTLSVLTMGVVDQRRITAMVTGAKVEDAKADLRKNNIIVKECE